METMNKFAKDFINVERHKLESRERMTTLLIESNEKLVIKQMEFELESQMCTSSSNSIGNFQNAWRHFTCF
jgi:hypothetical protein